MKKYLLDYFNDADYDIIIIGINSIKIVRQLGIPMTCDITQAKLTYIDLFVFTHTKHGFTAVITQLWKMSKGSNIFCITFVTVGSGHKALVKNLLTLTFK